VQAGREGPRRHVSRLPDPGNANGGERPRRPHSYQAPAGPVVPQASDISAAFLHAAETLGLAPQECVFIDDIEANVAAAVTCGMTGMHHTEAAATAAELQDLLGVPLDNPRHADEDRTSL
jgi:hypothetical protein